MGVLMIRVFFVLSYELLPKSSDSISFKSLLSKMFLSMLFIMLRKAILEQLKKWWNKWVGVSMSWPQMQIGLSEFRRPCLNLCSWRWLRPSLNLVSYLTLFGLWQLKTLLPYERTNFKSLFLKILKFSELHIF